MSDFGDRLAAAFADLVDLSVEERRFRLEILIRDDPELAEELKSLLRAHEADQGFLSPPDAVAIAHLLEADDRDQMPEKAGNWSLIRELGRGGLGVVYLAERAGDDYDQKAAVKLIKRGMDSDAILQRFQNERRILATLDHPNIARLMDGGVLADGRPWFAMEYVDGERLNRWCERQALSVTERLQLFVQVCRAVQSAHARLVVHRDLKPSNILVTREGRVKLLDFGIAKLIDDDSEQSTGLTRAGQRLLTPEYATPEQLEGGPVSVATDVYALGVILYEVLSGRHPYREESSTRETLTAAILESCPPRPSDRLQASVKSRSGIARRQLTGDLDAIVLTAMSGEVGDRYPSVEALAEDIERHLEGLPARARARSGAYLLGRFLRRHRIAVGAVAAVLIALSSGLGVAIWQASEARHQALLAEQSREFAISLLTEIAPSTQSDGVEMRAVDVLLGAADRVETADDLAPAVQGRLAAVIAEVLLELGSVDRALSLAELGVERLEASSNRDAGLLANNYSVLARMQVNLGQDVASEASARRGLELLEPISEPTGAERLTRIELLEMQARRLGNRYESAAAIGLRRQSLQDRLALFDPDHVNVAAGHYNLASELHTGGDFSSAEHHYREVGRIMSAIDADHPRRANVFMGIGVTQIAQGRLEDAEASLGLALETGRKHYGESSGVVASCLAHLGHLRRLQGRYEEAYELFNAVAYPAERDRIDYVQAVASSWSGMLGLSLGQAQPAIDHFQRASDALDELGHREHPQRLIAFLGRTLARSIEVNEFPDLPRVDEVMDQLMDAGAGPSQLHGEGAELMAAIIGHLGRSNEAARWNQRARMLFTAHFGPDHPRTMAVGRLYPPARSPDGEG